MYYVCTIGENFKKQKTPTKIFYNTKKLNIVTLLTIFKIIKLLNSNDIVKKTVIKTM